MHENLFLVRLNVGGQRQADSAAGRLSAGRSVSFMPQGEAALLQIEVLAGRVARSTVEHVVVAILR